MVNNMPKTISSDKLTENAVFLVRGKVAFSRVTRHTTDEERQKDNLRRMHPFDKNYTTISLYEASILCKDPQAPTLEEQFGAEQFYKSSSAKTPGANFTAHNKSKYLPQIFVRAPQPGNENHYEPATPEGELASGLDVTVVMHVFAAKGRKGVSFDRIMVNEPIRYFGGTNAIDAALNDFGYTFTAAPRQMEAAQQPAQAAAPAEAQPVAPEAPAMDQAFSAAPAAPAAPAPAGDNPFSAVGTPGNMGPGARQY